jgi:insertion element IS1 protein InsB
MICPKCQSTKFKKNGHKRGKQNHLCSDCGHQFIDNYSPLGYPEDVKKHCLHLYVEGNGFRRIERLTGVCHNTVINWVKAARLSLSQQPDYDEIPEVAQIDELQTFVGNKKTKFGFGLQ